jgi:D-beta-D-heptose 7-phosphate kinase/D-beta-D-heptose 1-phosphate adenosyltransferase
MTLAAALDQVRGRRITVVGDVMLDRYVFGRVERISPEAPVPVVEVETEDARPGGAGNAAANVVSLGGRCELFGVVGSDEDGKVLSNALEARDLACDGLVISVGRPTTTKTRIYAHGQQVVRTDRETVADVTSDIVADLVERSSRALEHSDALLVCDYGKGAVVPEVAAALIGVARRTGVPVVLDPKGREWGKYAGATLVTPNVSELAAGTGAWIDGDADLRDAADRALSILGNDSALLVTLGARGMELFARDRPGLRVAAAALEVFDVAGAGDTVAAMAALGVSAGLSDESITHLATRAAGIAVGRVGTIAVSASELFRQLDT